MRPELDGPTYVGQPRERLHLYVFKVPQHLHLKPHSNLEATAILRNAVVASGLLTKLEGAAHKVLEVFCACAHGQYFKQTGQLFCWPGEAMLLEETGISARSIYRGISHLVKLGVAIPGTAEIDGRELDGHYLQAPDVPHGWHRRRQTVRAARGILGKKARVRPALL